MARCPECEAEVRELREVAAILAAAVAERPPASLKAAVDARIAVTRQTPPLTDPAHGESSPGTRQRTGRRRLRAGWSVAAALALLAAGLGWRAVDQQDRLDALNAQATQISQLLTAPDVATTRVAVTGGGSALLVDSRSRNEAALSFTGLSGAPAGKTYQLWLMAPDGAARSVGLLQATQAQPILVQGLAGQSQVGMTIEPAGGSTSPTSVPVMVAALAS
ncbi:anti-sigma factor [Actinospica durhamensis]|uniref:Regulator of SigK n=2 Tax=Actinospica durhamensis TaxID=1508375 RepID=A0A941ESD1_9ACTN|nr:anti-sigma factor [Actinospica durhamensis]